MPAIFDALVAYFGPDVATPVPGQPILGLSVETDGGTWDCFAHAREAERQFLFYSVYPDLVPPARRAAMAEFLTRANFGLARGNFELDLDGGTVRFKTGVDVDGDRLSPAQIEGAVDVNLATMDRYLPGIHAIIETDADPAEVIALIEGAPPVDD